MPKSKQKVSKAVVKYVNNKLKVNSELKTYDNMGQTFPVTTSWAVLIPEAIGQGVTVSTRIGEQIKMFEMKFRAYLATSTSGTALINIDNSSRVRFIVFRDKHGGSAPTGQGSASTSLMSTNVLDAQFNLETIERYEIVYDRIYNILQSPTTVGPMPTSDVKGVVSLDIHRKHKRPVLIDYLDTTGTLPSKNRLYLAIIADTLATSQVIQLRGGMRIRYRDE